MSILIYKSDRIGEVSGRFVDNEVKGVFGEVIDISRIPRDNPGSPNVLTSENRRDRYNFIGRVDTRNANGFILNLLSEVNLPGVPIPIPVGATVTGPRSVISYEHRLVFNFELRYNYIAPIENVVVNRARLFYSRTTNSGSGNGFVPDSGGGFPFIPNSNVTFIHNTYPNQTSPGVAENIMMPLNETVRRPASGTTTQHTRDFTISNLEIDDFSVRFTATLNAILTSTLSAGSGIGRGIGLVWSGLIPTPTPGTWWAQEFNFSVVQPSHIEIEVSGDTYRIIPQAFQHGELKNAFEVYQNSLITTKTTKADPYTRAMNEKMTSEWENGKRNFNIEVVAPNELYQIQDSVKILKVRRGEIDENNPQEVNNASILQNPNGEAVEFEITSAEFRYNGMATQVLDLIEKT